MSRFNPRGDRDLSSPQIRVRGVNDLPLQVNQRLRLPNERTWSLNPLPLLRILLPFAILAGLGVGVYFGVAELVKDDGAAVAETGEAAVASEDQAAAQTESQSQADQTGPPAAQQQQEAQAEPPGSSQEESTAPVEADTSDAAEPEQDITQEVEQEEAVAQSGPSEAVATELEPTDSGASRAQVDPTVSEEPFTTASVDGAELIAERITAEAVPAGIPRTLGDGEAYDATDPTAAFTALWPVGTTLRLTRLPGATLLSDEEQAEVVGTEALVVVRGSENSNTDLQLSPAAFDRIAFYGEERIIAVRVEVTAPPP